VITIHQRHRQTDGQTDRQTDGQTTCDRNTALCTKVHRAVKTTTCDVSDYAYITAAETGAFLGGI